MTRRTIGLGLVLAVLCSLPAAMSGQAPGTAPYLNPDLSPEQRAASLVSRMTLEEKVRQMQNSAPAIPRLNIPAYDWWNEALHGVARAGEATVFPQAVGMAATWDTDLMFREADIISTEARAKYNQAIRQDNHRRYYGLTFWSPNINIFRDPRWGRGQETYGEDPFLTGRLAVAFIHGMQGDDPKYFKVIATAKHFAVHSGPESTRHTVDIRPTARDLADTYLPAFKAAIVDGKADSVMCAYNSVDGLPACANPELLQTVLRKDWNFQGYVVSDCGAVRDVYQGHHTKATAAEASVAVIRAGTDLTCGNEFVTNGSSLMDAVAAGQIRESELDAALVRLFTARFKLGMFDPPERVPYANIPYSVVDSTAHRAVALEAARKAIVLLKNEGNTLPLASSVKRIAVIGPSANDPDALLGNYNGFSKDTVTPLEGIERQFAGKAQVQYVLGSTYVPGQQSLVSAYVLIPPSGSGHGLLAEYFDNPDLSGQPRLRRVEASPYLPTIPDPALAAAGVPARGYSVRWTGTLNVPSSGEYLFGARNGGTSLHLFLDDRDVLTDTAPGFGRVAMASVILEPGRNYAMRVEFRPPPPPPPTPPGAATSGRGARGRGGPGRGFGGGTPTNVQLVWVPPADGTLAEAVKAVRDADVTVAFVGLNPSLEGEEMRVQIPGFSGGDRTDLKLPAQQEKLLEAAIATGKPVVVILTSGSAVAVNYAAEHAAAVLEAWYGGEEVGTAIAETLAGVNNPGGRLPVTFYRSVDQIPAFDDYDMSGRTYRYFTGDPLYRFGYGLSYSTFAYSGLQAGRTASGATVSARVTNSSKTDGDEVVQLYFAGTGAPDAPVRSLRGFQRVHLKAGESRDVTFEVPADDVPAAQIRISVGGGQPVGTIPHVEGTL